MFGKSFGQLKQWYQNDICEAIQTYNSCMGNETVGIICIFDKLPYIMPDCKCHTFTIFLAVWNAYMYM